MNMFFYAVTLAFSILAVCLFLKKKLSSEITAIWIGTGVFAGILIVVSYVPAMTGVPTFVYSLFPALIFAAISAQCIILAVFIEKTNVRLKKLTQAAVVKEAEKANVS